MSLLISSFRSRILHSSKALCGLWLCPTNSFCDCEAALPVIPKTSVLYLHHLAPYLSQDLLSPPVCFVQVVALCCQVRPFLLRAPCLLSFARQEPVEHGLCLLFISCHLYTQAVRCRNAVNRSRSRGIDLLFTNDTMQDQTQLHCNARQINLSRYCTAESAVVCALGSLHAASCRYECVCLSVCAYERCACICERGRTCLCAMLKLLYRSFICPSRVTSSVPQLGLLRRTTRRMSASDRSYPKEPRVGVGVVILRPGPVHPQDKEVSRAIT